MKVIPVILETLSPTRVGSSGVYFDYSAADIMTYKIPLQYGDKIYYIPAIAATSFKGVLRATYERAVRKGELKATTQDSTRTGNPNSVENEIEKTVKTGLEVAKRGSEEARIALLRELMKELRLAYYAGLIKNNSSDNTLGDKIQLLEKSETDVQWNDELFAHYLRLYLVVTGAYASQSCYVTSDFDKCENLELLEDPLKKEWKKMWAETTGREQGICGTCGVFGTTGIRGYVKFTDLIAVDPYPVYLERLTHVAINRITGASEKHKLFTEEVVPAGVKFLGFVIVLDESKVDVVKRALEELRKRANAGEVWIGGRGTSGYGSFKLSYEGEVEFSDNSLTGPQKIELGERQLTEDIVASRDQLEQKNLLVKLFPRGLVCSMIKCPSTSNSPGSSAAGENKS